MKNLKKVLALVLALATVFGLGISASAQYTDDSSIEYTEAVEVMSMIDVLGGNPDGSFNPQGNLTRAQAAKMVSYLLNSGKDVNDLYSGANTFTDCYNSWAKGYIAYVNQMGIVAGVGNGKFNPDGTLTGVALAKMMLTSLGYDADIEGYQANNNWQVNIINDAKDAGLLKGLNDVNLYNAITREQASQMMFNALKATMVRYDSKGTEIDLGNGVVIKPSGGDAEKIVNNETSYKKADDTAIAGDKFTGTMELCEKYFDGLQVAVDGDDFNRPANIWTYKKDTVTATATADYTYTAATAAKDVYADLGKSVVDDLQADKMTLEVYRNGGSNDTALAKKIVAALKKDNDKDLTENGLLTEVYVQDTKVIITLTDTVLAKVSKVDDKDEDNLVLSLDSVKGGVNINSVSEETLGMDLSKFEEDQYVLVTGVANSDGKYDVKSIAVAESFDGKQTAYKGTEHTIDGTKYTESNNFVAMDELNFDDTFTFYKDAYGYIVGAALKEEAEVAGSYLYVTAAQGEKYSEFNGDAWAQASVTMADGSKQIVDLAIKDAGKDSAVISGTEIKPENAKSELKAGWYSYTTTSDGTYKLSAVAKLEDSTAYGDVIAFVGKVPTYSSGSATITYNTGKTVRANSSTVLSLVSDGKSYTGYKNFVDSSKLSGTEALYVLSSKGGSLVKNIYVMGEQNITESTTYAYVVGLEQTDAKGDQYKFFIDGEAKFYYVDENTTNKELLKDTKTNPIVELDVDTDGVITKVTSASAVTGEVTAVEGTDYFTVDGTTYYFENVDEDTVCKVFNADTGAEDKISKNDTVVIVSVANKAGEKCAVVVYVK